MAIQPWNGVNQTWSEIQIKWSDVFLIQELLDAIRREELLDAIRRGGSYQGEFQKLPKEKKKRFIELTLLIKGQDIYNSKKEIKDDIKLSTSDIKLTIQEVLKKVNIEIDV
jgi:hypothetical protein